jgi:hypothetical protein
VARTIARGQFTYYWLHIDAEVGERDLAAFCGASSVPLLLVVIVLAILVVRHGPDEHQEPPGEKPQGIIAPPPAFDHPSANQADPHTFWATQSWRSG